MDTIKCYTCGCGEDFYEDDLECVNCGLLVDTRKFEDETLVRIKHPPTGRTLTPEEIKRCRVEGGKLGELFRNKTK